MPGYEPARKKRIGCHTWRKVDVAPVFPSVAVATVLKGGDHLRSFPSVSLDYLLPGSSVHFELHAEVMRLGSRVASNRMEFRGDDGKLLSTGAGAYIVS